MRKLFAFVAALFIGTPCAWSVPAYPHPIVHTQSDGTRITIRIIGDEYQHYILSQEGYSLVGGGNAGDLYYATLAADGTLAPTSVKARPFANLTAEERTLVSKLPKGVKPTAVSAMNATRPVMKAPQTRADGKIYPPMRISEAPTTGNPKSLIILVNLSDRQYTTPAPNQAFHNLLMQDGYSVNGGTGSAWNYYQDNSNKRFDPNFVVVGPYTVSKTSSYYAGGSGSDNAVAMIVEAAQLADADIDFTEFSDNGKIRDIFVFYAGINQAETGDKTSIWPHRWNVKYGGAAYQNIRLDGQLLDGYACSSELNGSRKMAGIGTFCHEFGHVMGWHDFYDTDYGTNGSALGLDDTSLMASGSYNNDGRTPPALNILERWMAGWTEPQEITEKGSYTLDPVWNDKGYLVRTSVDNDYFLFETRATGGNKWDDKFASSGGMLVYHIDYTTPQTWANNRVNAYANHECAKLIPAMSSSFFFPGRYETTDLTTVTNSNYKAWNGSSPNFSLSDITLDGSQIKFNASTLIEMQAVNQYEAILRWDNPNSANWRISWFDSDGKQIGARSVTDSYAVLGGLMPGKTYNVTLKTASLTLSYSFTTLEQSPDKGARINIPATGISSKQPFLLNILDFKGSIFGTEWEVDGQKVTDPYVTLSAGEHKIKATVTATDATKQYIIKYVTVQ